ncbi:GNAT family N-acetyltransferase [Photobacterium sp. SDRW27]|uniref:GNAT family N-acetyltransferase n=1 Tax=Photobacterium obscurum TaxID=2829490 RepID=UPI002243E699|nr:GNAT family N-acetyltransferase [Photobacterium obscurum]MCW8330145.1 GNAT family N-acetyltransferase [Photobacterium obscurum]
MENSRIKLVPPSMERAPSMLEAIIESEVELRQYLPWVDSSLTEADSISNTEKAIENFESFTGELRYSIIRKSDDHFLGAIGLMIRDKAVPFFEIGYWIRTSETGKGYVSEAVSLIEEYAFNECKARRIEITAASTNFKSRSVAERCGYQLDTVFANAHRLPSGELSDTAVYSKICS